MAKNVKEPKVPKQPKQTKPEKVAKTPKTDKAPKAKSKGLTFGKKKAQDDTDLSDLPVFVPVLPSADLLPQALRDAVALRRVQTQVVGAAVLAFALFVLIYVGQQGLIIKANADLNDETGKASVLANETKKYLPVKAFYGQITSNSQQVLNNMSKEVATAKTISTIVTVSQKSVSLDTLDIKVDTTVGGAQNAVAPATTTTEVAEGCPQINLFDPHSPAVGCVQITGHANSRADLSQWVSDIEGESMFVSPFISDTTAGDGNVTFTASVGVTAKVFSFRYTQDYLNGAGK